MFTVWFDPQETSDISTREEFEALADSYGLKAEGRSTTPCDQQERWSATYEGGDHLMHILNMWTLNGWRHLIYRGNRLLSQTETFDWVRRRSNARELSHAIH